MDSDERHEGERGPTDGVSSPSVDILSRAAITLAHIYLSDALGYLTRRSSAQIGIFDGRMRGERLPYLQAKKFEARLLSVQRAAPNGGVSEPLLPSVMEMCDGWKSFR